jgi:hypothetical protein
MKIKYLLLSIAGLFLAALSTAFLGQGCVESIPPLSAVVVTATPTLAPYVISNFENGSVTVNPNLANWSKSYWQASTYGGAGTCISGCVTTVTETPTITACVTMVTAANTINNPFIVPNTVPDSTNSSGLAVYVFAPLIAVGTWESDQLKCRLNTDTSGTQYPYYDASASFTGIQFLINIPANNTSNHRVFQVAIDQTLPVTELGGTAPTTACSCYSHFEVALPSGSTGGWTLVSHPWTDFIDPCGSIMPAGLENHLDKIVFLQFSFSSGTQGTTCSPESTYTNFWVDDVRFLP